MAGMLPVSRGTILGLHVWAPVGWGQKWLTAFIRDTLSAACCERVGGWGAEGGSLQWGRGSVRVYFPKVKLQPYMDLKDVFTCGHPRYFLFEILFFLKIIEPCPMCCFWVQTTPVSPLPPSLPPPLVRPLPGSGTFRSPVAVCSRPQLSSPVWSVWRHVSPPQAAHSSLLPLKAERREIINRFVFSGWGRANGSF